MCFALDDKKYPGIQLADKDIICYKTTVEGRGLLHFKSNIRGFIYLLWKRNKRVSLEVYSRTIIDYACADFITSTRRTIEEGYHAFKTKLQAKLEEGSSTKIGKFKIPAGTWYYENDTQYVAERLTYLGPTNKED